MAKLPPLTRERADALFAEAQVLMGHELDRDRQRFEAGDRNALLAAVRLCANFDLVMPEWLSSAFIAAYDDVLRARKGSWDEAFGKPYPKGAHLATIRKHRTKRLQLWLGVSQLRWKEGNPKDAVERVGESLGLGRSLAHDLYNEAVKMLGPSRPQKAKKLRIT
jgi:hypothetical protein